MAEHKISLVRDESHKFVATCTCKRWRSNAYTLSGDARNAGDAHVVRGDEHNRAIAAFQRSGRASLANDLKWYEKQANDPLNSEEDREQWALLADELRARVGGEDDTIPLF